MKKLNYFLMAALIMGALAGCKNDDDPSTEETPLQKRVSDLARTWETGTVTDEEVAKLEGEDGVLEGTFTITFSQGTVDGETAAGQYTSEATGEISGIEEGLPVESSFTIGAGSLNQVTLENGTVISIISVSDSNLTFSVPGKSNKGETTFTYELVPAE